MKNTITGLVISLAVLAITGCSKSDKSLEIQGLVTSYAETGDRSTLGELNALIYETVESRAKKSIMSSNQGPGFLYQSEKIALNNVGTQLQKHEAFEVIGYLAAEIEYTDAMYEWFKTYNGTNWRVHAALASKFANDGFFKSAYDSGSKAGIIEHDFVVELRSLVSHFGCSLSNSVWAELDTGAYSSRSLVPTGTKYKELILNVRQKAVIPVLRRNLRIDRSIPNLSPDCPINLYG